MALYETVLIIRQDMSSQDVDNLVTNIEKVVADNKAKLISKEYWGLRKLAYKINKNDKAHYVMLNIDADNAAVNELNRVFKFNEDIVRSMVIANKFGNKDKTELFECENASEYKPSNSKDKADKYENIADQMQFDN